MNKEGTNISESILAWTITRKLRFRFLFVYVLLFILTLSFPHPYIPDLPSLVAPFFEQITGWAGDKIFKIKHPYTSQLISDSTGLYIHLLLLVVYSFAITIVWSITDKRKKSYSILSSWFRVLISYYLAFYLLSYGLNKIFKWQFYLPEPNTLFTTLGNTYRDILYWSTMGTSHSYNIFLGSLEIIAALLLLFKKTRLVGSVMAFIVLLNIVAVNFSFDISVKIFSCFLLFLSVIIAAPGFKRLYIFFFTNYPVPAESLKPPYVTTKSKRVYPTIKILIIGYMFISLLSVYMRTGNFNDDKADRPLFHGAYDVTIFIKNNDTLLPLIIDRYRWKRLFIHRRGYLILQAMNDEMQDYSFLCDTVGKHWFIKREGTSEDAVLNYRQTSDTTITLTTTIGADFLKIHLRKIDLNRLPLLQKEFNWTIDGFN